MVDPTAHDLLAPASLRHRMRKRLPVLLMAVLLGLAWLLGHGLVRDLLLKDQRSAVRVRAASLGSAVEAAVGARFALLHGLAAHVTAELKITELSGIPTGFADRFEAFAEPLFQVTPGLRNLSVAPGAVQRFVYPYKGNETVIGHALLEDQRPGVREGVWRAIDTGAVTITGPYELRQGGQGLVARLAVREEGRPWGLVTMVLNLPVVIAASGVAEAAQGLHVGLSTEDGQLFYRSGGTVEFDHPVSQRVRLPDGHWHLLVQPALGWDRAIAADLLLFHGLAGAMFLLLVSLTALLASRHRHLAEAVALKSALQRQSESNLQAILDHAPTAITLQDPDGRYLVVNRKFEEVCGLPAAQVRGKRPHDILPLQHADAIAAIAAQVAADGTPAHVERSLGEDARHVHWATVFPLFDERGRVLAVADISLDVTGWRSTQEALRLVEQAKATAEAESRAKSAFLASMSHELRTPLNAIIGFSDAIREQIYGPIQPAAYGDYIANIHTSGRQLLGLIGDILDLSKIEAGRMELHPAACDLAALIDDIAVIAQPLAIKQGNRLIVDKPAELGEMTIDESRLRQVLLNLLANACKFTRDGTVRLRASRSTDEWGRGWIGFAVSDTGVGIASDDLDKLFKDFSQLAAPLHSRAEGGTGLGLAISRRLCELMGGTIAVSSRLGEGSTFQIRLPCEPVMMDEECPSRPIGCRRRRGRGR